MASSSSIRRRQKISTPANLQIRLRQQVDVFQRCRTLHNSLLLLGCVHCKRLYCNRNRKAKKLPIIQLLQHRKKLQQKPETKKISNSIKSQNYSKLKLRKYFKTYFKTRLLSSRKQTTRKCVYSVTLVWPWPMTLILDLDLDSMKMFLRIKNEACRPRPQGV